MAKSNGDRSPATGTNGNGRVEQLALSAWEIEQSRHTLPEGDATRGATLRAHQRLQAEIEQSENVDREQRSLLRIQPGSDEAVLVIHGSTGSPRDVAGLVESLHKNGLTVYAPLLPGHGVAGETLPDVKWRTCLREVVLRFGILRRTHRKVHVVGFSFGAALAVHLARKESVASLCLLAPALVPRVSLLARIGLALRLHRLPFLRARFGWDLEVFEAMSGARAHISRLRCAIYAAHCEDDPRIDPASLRMLQKKVRNRASRFRLFQTGGHMILDAHGETALNAEIHKFLAGVRD